MGTDRPHADIRTDKAMIRKQILAKRNSMSAMDCRSLSQAICDRFLSCDEYERASVILLYKAYNNEVDTDRIFERAVADGKTVAYPRSRIVDGEPEMTFCIVDDLSALKCGYKGIPEPADDAPVIDHLGKADICITPGVAYDKKGHRIGYGKAFYDRYLRLHTLETVVGLCYELQMTSDITTGERDMSADMVITERAVYRP